MIWFCSAARFNESINAFGRLESVGLGGLALPVSGALTFNYHKLVVLIHLLLFLWAHSRGGRRCVRDGADGISASVRTLRRNPHPSLACRFPAPISFRMFIHPTRGVCLGHWLALTLYLAFKSGAACVCDLITSPPDCIWCKALALIKIPSSAEGGKDEPGPAARVIYCLPNKMERACYYHPDRSADRPVIDPCSAEALDGDGGRSCQGRRWCRIKI